LRTRILFYFALLAGLLLSAGPLQAQEPAAENPGIEIGTHVIGGLYARSIGPAVMSGRISALDVVNDDPRVIFAGSGGGGLWRSRDGGARFEPIFDDHNQCIGSITIDQAHPDTIWVGTGEVWVRNSVSVGDGIYKSVNGGDKWEKMGLENTERIGRIIVHPEEPDIVYAAALGHLWNANEERGLYKTSDGGATWEKILYIDQDTGCTDVWIDPQEPDIVYAAMWQFRRSPDFFTSGGPGSGLHKSTDGGATWKRLTKGLPEGELGRIALAVAPSRPNRLYATVEAKKSAFYRSDDLGESWQRMSSQPASTGRPFYFSLLVPDPVDHERVYKTSTGLWVTRDGGVTFVGVGGWVHSDYHAMWINPADPNHIVVGTDGGVYITDNRSTGWRHVSNLPVSQFYRVSVDDQRPFKVYGGLQDNGSWMAPSRARGGIENSDWENLGGGDGFAVVSHPADPNIVYWEWQGGNISRKDLRSGESKDIKPLPRADEPKYRFNWNTPLLVSPHDPERLYTGSQFLHFTDDRGESWASWGGDLTTNDPQKQRQEESGGLTIDNTAAEKHCTVFTISESPVEAGVLWVGTDDGNLQVAETDRKMWRNTSKKIDGLPKGTWVSCVEASSHDRDMAFATFDGHRTGDRTPYVYLTRDLGRTWTSITTEDVTGHAHVIRQDPVNPDLLFLGTEEGLFITLDQGLHWARYEEDFPPVSIRDMTIQARESSLVLATHGRGIFIIDDITSLRQVTAAVLAQDVTLLDSRPAVLRIPQGKQQFPGDTHYVARNPGTSAQIVYYLSKRHMFGEMKLEIFDAEGELLKLLPGGKRKGLNFVRWSPRLKPPKVAPSPTLDPATSFAGAVGPAAPEGQYTYKLTKGKKTYEGVVAVEYAFDYPHPPEERKLQQQAVSELYGMLGHLAYVAEAAAECRDQARERADDLKKKDKLGKKLRAFADDLDAFHSTLMVTEEVQGISGLKRLRENVVRLYAGIAGYGGRPTQSQLDRLEVFRAEISEANGRFDELIAGRLAGLNKDLEKKDLAEIVLLTEEAFKKRGD
jgi:photosystem II stability/assembly factor-like uncharacterized protein